MTLKEFCNKVKQLIKESNHCMLMYEAIVIVATSMSNEDLIDFLSAECHAEATIRGFLVDQTAREVIKKIGK